MFETKEQFDAVVNEVCDVIVSAIAETGASVPLAAASILVLIQGVMEQIPDPVDRNIIARAACANLARAVAKHVEAEISKILVDMPVVGGQNGQAQLH